MKRVTSALVLSILAGATLVAGCKHDSAKAKPGVVERQPAGDDGPLVTPNGPGLGSPEQSPADRAAARGARPGARLRGPAGPADAQDGAGPRAWIDGLSPEERQARREEMRARREERRKEMLATFDADGDGQLTGEERQAMHVARISEMVDRLDADGDGKVSKSELADLDGRGRFAPPQIDKLDLDHDGFVTVDEMAKVMPQRGPRNRDGFRGSGDGLRGDLPGPGQPGAPSTP